MEQGLWRFPTLEVHFAGGLKTLWHPGTYLQRKNPDGNWHVNGSLWCTAFKDGKGRQVVLGATWMRDHEIIFDLVHGRLGVADAECPRHSVAQRAPAPAIPAAALRARKALEDEHAAS